jgi:hypothetical protein
MRVLSGPGGPGLVHTETVQHRAVRGGWTSYGPLAERTPSLVLGWALGTFSLGIGILVGWVIWGQ